MELPTFSVSLRPPPPPRDHHLLGVHAQHHAQRGVTTGSEVVPVAAHADGVQPVPHGEAPAAIPAPAEVEAALGKDRGRAPGAQGPLVSGRPGPLPSSGTLALATCSLHLGSAVGKGSEGPRLGRRGLRKAQAERGLGPRLGLIQLSQGRRHSQGRTAGLGWSWGGSQVTC